MERLKRLKEAKQRLQREAEAGAKAVQEHVDQRRAEEEATGKKKRGRKPKVVEPLPTEEAKANTTDPDSRIMKSRQGYVQGYNAQAVVSEEQIIVAVGVTQEANDVQQLFHVNHSCRFSVNQFCRFTWSAWPRCWAASVR